MAKVWITHTHTHTVPRKEQHNWLLSKTSFGFLLAEVDNHSVPTEHTGARGTFDENPWQVGSFHMHHCSFCLMHSHPKYSFASFSVCRNKLRVSSCWLEFGSLPLKAQHVLILSIRQPHAEVGEPCFTFAVSSEDGQTSAVFSFNIPIKIALSAFYFSPTQKTFNNLVCASWWTCLFGQKANECKVLNLEHCF